MMEKCLNNPSGKCKKALYRLHAINKQLKKIIGLFECTRETLIEIIENPPENEKIKSSVIPCQKEKFEELRKRSMVKRAPKRIRFKLNDFKFYIDFTVVSSNAEDQFDIKGAIVYGTNRTLCFSECILPKSNDSKVCENCDRIARCDRLEDKPLLQFLINQHGMIQASEKLEGEWWADDTKDLQELHYRALDLIWMDALDWTNENLLP